MAARFFMIKKPNSDDKIVYQLSLNNKNLGVINSYLFVEKFQEVLLVKLLNINVPPD
jgi:hypothetical protein